MVHRLATGAASPPWVDFFSDRAISGNRSLLGAKRTRRVKATRTSAVTAKSRSRNRRVAEPSSRRRAPSKGPRTAIERKIRNRTIAGLGLLALVNAYVFLLGDGVSTFSGLESAAIGARPGPLPPLADPPEIACTRDPVRIFENLHGLLLLSTPLHGGTTLRLALLGLGVSPADIDRIEANIRSKVDLGLLGGSGSPLRVAVDRLGSVHALEIELSEGHVLQACRTDEGFDVRNLQHPLRTDVEVLALELGRHADLATAVREAGEAPELAELIAKTFAYDVDFLTETRPGDTISVMVEKRWLGRRFHRYGEVLAARFRGSLRRASMVRYTPEGGRPTLYDVDGSPVARTMLRSPVAYFTVDPEARPMLAPAVEVVHGNLGAAYRLPEGAPVVALGDGTIRAADRTVDEGNFLDLELDGGILVRYAHLMRTVGDLTPGTRVATGQILGLAGHTGRTPHDRLRLELWAPSPDGTMTALDPSLLTVEGPKRAAPVGAPIAEARLVRFREDTAPQRRALRLVH